MKLTKTTVKKLSAPDPSGKQTIYWDGDDKEAISGFGVLVSGVTSAKTYIVQHKLANRNTRRVTVGPTEVGGVGSPCKGDQA